MFFNKGKLLRLQIEELQKKNDAIEEEKELLLEKLKEVRSEMYIILKTLSSAD